jgi:hypothetical protein
MMPFESVSSLFRERLRGKPAGGGDVLCRRVAKLELGSVEAGGDIKATIGFVSHTNATHGHQPR